jgi:hypothetical protein
MDREQQYIDVRHTAPDFAGYGFDLVQVKHDGEWCRVTVRGGVAAVTGRNGGVLATLLVPGVPDCVLIGEYMAGTERAKRDPMGGAVYVFDCLSLRGQSLADRSYARRNIEVHDLCFGVQLLAPVRTHRITPDLDGQPPTHTAAEHWQYEVCRCGAEGLIYRRSGDTYAGAVIGREKSEQTYDATATGETSPNGAPIFDLGEGVRQPIRDGVPVDELRPGRVAEFAAFARFKGTGKLRNPVFIRWRDDK